MPARDPVARSAGSMSLPQYAQLAHLLDLMEAPAESGSEEPRWPKTVMRELEVPGGAVQLVGMSGGLLEPPVMSLNVRDGDDQASALLTEAQALQLVREICQMIGGWRS